MTEMFKNQLLEMQTNLSKRIDAIKRDFSNGRSADFSEQATEQENEEVLVQLQIESETELRLVNAALSKIENGSYGDCEKCTESISQARLKAIPFAQFCINCA